jgi:hypothetical protein
VLTLSQACRNCPSAGARARARVQSSGRHARVAQWALNTNTDMSFFFTLSPGRWNTSEFTELPTLDADDDEAHLDYRLLAGGLALLLSRCSERGVRRDFAASLQAYRSLKRQLKSRAPVTLSAQLLMDLSHEIAQLADGTTRRAASRCLARNVQAIACPLGEPPHAAAF